MTYTRPNGSNTTYGNTTARDNRGRCSRSCCWTQYGHSGAAINCTCHDEQETE